MFKIRENTDGSTSIFCKISGQLICTIKGQQKDNCKKSNLTSKSSPLEEVSEKKRNLKKNYVHTDDTDETDSECESRENGKCSSSIPEPLEEPNEDYSEDCLTSDDFAKCLDLIPKEKLNNEDLLKLKATYPLRLLSRIKEPENAEGLRDLKFSEDLPLTSNLGKKILHLDPQKSFISDRVAQLSVKKYDSFCRFNVNTIEIEVSNLPKLRCREVRDYPICTAPKIMKIIPTHNYTFTKRQRMENLITIKTGLDARSRRLLRICQKKRPVPVITRLTDDEIAFWAAKKCHTFNSLKSETPVIDITDTIPEIIISDSENTDTASDSESCSDLDYTPSSRSSISTPNHLPKNTPNGRIKLKNVKFKPQKKSNKLVKSCVKKQYSMNSGTDMLRDFNCYVKVKDIMHRINKVSGTFYIKGTCISVPFYSDYLKKLSWKKVPKNASRRNNHLANFKNDHAYHLPFSSLPPSNHLAKLTNDHAYHLPEQKFNKASHLSSYKVYHTNTPKGKNDLVQSNQSKTTLLAKLSSDKMRTSKALAEKSMNARHSVTDLRKECVPISISAAITKNTVSKWTFNCFGCGHNCVFLNRNFMDTAVNEHMQKFHSVADPESFLSLYLNNTEDCVLIEAFPGYSSNLKH